MKGISFSQALSAFEFTYIGCATCNGYIKPTIVAKKTNNSHTPSSKDTDTPPPRITSNLKQNLQFLKLWKEFQKRKSSTPKPATSYRKKKVEKEELPDDEEIYRDPTLALYYTNQVLDTAVPVLLVDGYNVCGYWPKLKKHFLNGSLDIARQKLIDELVSFSLLRGLGLFILQ
uniref:RNA-binding protein containing a PIN domain n=1 Tax=Solanum tuberosum TaxID=4113 RepID=M0ZV66_SOLTU